MSTIITIRNEKKVTAETAIKKLLIDPQVKLYEHPFSGQPINYNNCKLFIYGESTRGIVVDTDKDEITICVNIMSSDADLDLAVVISKTLSKLCESPIWIENDPSPILSEDAENGVLRKALFENQVVGSMFIGQLLEQGEPVQIQGLFVDFWPGKEYLKEDNLIKLRTKLTSHFLNLQNLENKGIRITNPIVTEKDGKHNTFIFLTENHEQLILKCDSIVLTRIEPEEHIIVPFNIFIENLDIDLEKVDSVQMVFPALNTLLPLRRCILLSASNLF